MATVSISNGEVEEDLLDIPEEDELPKEDLPEEDRLEEDLPEEDPLEDPEEEQEEL